MYVKHALVVLSLCGAALIHAAEIDLEKALDPGIPGNKPKIVDAMTNLTDYMNDGKFLAFINQAHQYKTRTKTLIARGTVVEAISNNPTLQAIYEKIRDMGGEAAKVKAPVFRAFVSYYQALREEIDTLGVYILSDLDLGKAQFYLTQLTGETEEVPPAGKPDKWLSVLEERIGLGGGTEDEIKFLRETALKVLMNQTRQHLLSPPRSGAPGAAGNPCPTVSNRKRLLYMDITDEHRERFVDHLVQMRDLEALRAYFKTMDGSSGCLLRDPASKSAHSLDAIMTLMSPSSGAAGDLDAFGKSARKDLKELLLSTPKGGLFSLAESLCQEILESEDNRLKFLLFLTLHPDQGLASAIRNDFFLKQCSSAGFAKKFEDALKNFFDGTARPPSVDLLEGLRGRGFMNIEDMQIEDELNALVKKFAVGSTSTMGADVGQLAPTLFQETRRPQMLELLPRLYAAANPVLKAEIQSKRKDLIDRYRKKALEIFDQIRKQKDGGSGVPVIYQEGMIVELVRNSLNTGDLKLFEVICPVSVAGTLGHGYCYDVPLRLIEQFQAEVLAAAAKDGGRPNAKTAELLQAYRKDLTALNSSIKTQHAPKAAATGGAPAAAAGGDAKAAAAGMLEEMMSKGEKKEQASPYGLMDLKGVVKDYNLDLRRALRLLTDRVLTPLRMNLIEWRGQELLESATAEEEDLLSTLLAYAVQLKDLQMIYQIISKNGLKPSFQFTQGFQLLIGSILLTLAQEDCHGFKSAELAVLKLKLVALDIELQPLTELQEEQKKRCQWEAAEATTTSAAALPSPSTGEPPREFSALSKAHKPSVAESLLELLCDKFHCPFHRLEGDCMPQINFAALGATDQLPKLEPPRDGFAEQWLHRMVQLIALEKEAGAKLQGFALNKSWLESFFMNAILMLTKYMTFDPHANGDLIAFILEMARN